MEGIYESINYKIYAEKIHIEESAKNPDFVQIVEKALEYVESTPTGNRLIEKIKKGKHVVKIIYSEVLNGCARPHPDTSSGKRKVGCPSNIYFTTLGTSGYDFNGNKLPLIDLVNELILACHNSYGKNSRKTQKTSIDKDIWYTPEEYKTIIGFKNSKITENKILEEHERPKRFGYYLYNFGYPSKSNAKALENRVKREAQSHELQEGQDRRRLQEAQNHEMIQPVNYTRIPRPPRVSHNKSFGLYGFIEFEEIIRRSETSLPFSEK
jgi:Effector protein